MRPLLITENYPPGRGGMAQSCDRIVRGLRARGLDVDVLHLGGRGELHVEQHERGRLVACPVDEDPAHALNLAWSALQRIDETPTHVLAFGGLLPMLCAPVFSAWLGAPLVTLLRGNDFDTGVFSLRRGWMLRDALARSAVVCAVSEDHRRKVSGLFPGQHVVRIANGIDATDWALLDIDREHARAWRAANVSPVQRVIGLFGHLKQKKGGVFLLDALAGGALPGGVHLLVVGEIEPALEQRMQALAGTIAWTHVPFLDRFELLRWYAACDAVAIPSLYDGLPNVALEAGALGVPVIGSTAGGLADLLVDGENALTFAPGDLHACRRALDVAAESADLAALGRSLQATVLRDFDQRSEAARYHELLRDLAAPMQGARASTSPQPATAEDL
ncbi:MAG: glycosyltransferase family 4 protein [Rudaea sp.]